MLYGIFSINQICCISDFFKFIIAQTDWLIYLRKQFRGVELRKCCACPWASHLKLEAPRSLYSSPGYNNNISQ